MADELADRITRLRARLKDIKPLLHRAPPHVLVGIAGDAEERSLAAFDAVVAAITLLDQIVTVLEPLSAQLNLGPARNTLVSIQTTTRQYLEKVEDAFAALEGRLTEEPRPSRPVPLD